MFGIFAGFVVLKRAFCCPKRPFGPFNCDGPHLIQRARGHFLAWRVFPPCPEAHAAPPPTCETSSRSASDIRSVPLVQLPQRAVDVEKFGVELLCLGAPAAPPHQPRTQPRTAPADACPQRHTKQQAGCVQASEKGTGLGGGDERGRGRGGRAGGLGRPKGGRAVARGRVVESLSSRRPTGAPAAPKGCLGGAGRGRGQRLRRGERRTTV